MTIIELIKNEFVSLFPSLFHTKGVDFDTLIETPKTSAINKLKNLAGVEGVNEDERSKLLYFIQLLDEAESGADYDPGIELKLLGFVEKFPDQLSFRFFLILYMVDGFIELGYTKDELIGLYSSVFKEHSELVKLDDFFTESKILLPILLSIKHPKELLRIFKDAIKTYPDKAYLKNVLARIYETNNDFENALSYVLQFLGQLEREKTFDKKTQTNLFSGDYIANEDYYLALNTAADLSFKMEDYKSTLFYCDELLGEYRRNPDDIWSFQNLFIDPTVIRLRIFMRQNDDAFKKEFELLKSKVDKEVLLEEEYRDIVEYSIKIELNQET